LLLVHVEVSEGNGKIYQASTLRSIDAVSHDEWEALAKEGSHKHQ
jgi:hypothetical protein